MSGARNRWRRPWPTPRRCWRPPAIRQGRGARLQLHPEPRHPPHPQAARRTDHRRRQPSACRDGRGLHGRSRRPLLLETCSIVRLRRHRRFRSAYPIADLGAVWTRIACHVRHVEALRQTAGSWRRHARGRNLRYRQRPDPPRQWRRRHAAGQPLGLGSQGPHRDPDLRLQGVDPVRPGTLQRVPALRHQRQADRAGLPDNPNIAPP